MAPSSGAAMVPLAMRLLRHLSKKASKLIGDKVASLQPARAELQPILLRNEPRHPIHRIAWLRQNSNASRRRWFATGNVVNSTVRRFTSGTSLGGRPAPRASLPKSATGSAVASLTRSIPFASTLRPNLTGGAVPRTAGGYTIGAGRIGGPRHFSHTPAAPAEVVSNVSAAVRAFWLAGQRAHFDGLDARTGEKRFKTVTQLRDQATRKMHVSSSARQMPGSHIDFHISPTITTMTSFASFPSSIASAPARTLNADGFLHELSVDFARAVKDLAVVLADLERLAQLGDLPLSVAEPGVVRVSFPGCDAEMVERLGAEVGLRRGVVWQDEGFVGCSTVGDDEVGERDTELALLFPLAPGVSSEPSSAEYTERRGEDQSRHQNPLPEAINWHHMLASCPSPSAPPRAAPSAAAGHMHSQSFSSSPQFSSYASVSQDEHDYDHYRHSTDEYAGSYADEQLYMESLPSNWSASRGEAVPADFEGVTGLYRFWEESGVVGC